MIEEYKMLTLMIFINQINNTERYASLTKKFKGKLTTIEIEKYVINIKFSL